jgi:hypothetical protein
LGLKSVRIAIVYMMGVANIGFVTATALLQEFKQRHPTLPWHARLRIGSV